MGDAMRGWSWVCLSVGLLCVGVAPVRALSVGSAMPEIGLRDRAGQPVNAASLLHKVVIVDFWATWCEPCRQELPQLQKLHQKYAAQGLAIVGVSVDEKVDGLDEFLGKFGISFAVVHDPEHKVTSRFAPPRMPSSYVIDRSGIVRYVHAGFRISDVPELEKQVRELLAR